MKKFLVIAAYPAMRQFGHEIGKTTLVTDMLAEEYMNYPSVLWPINDDIKPDYFRTPHEAIYPCAKKDNGKYWAEIEGEFFGFEQENCEPLYKNRI